MTDVERAIRIMKREGEPDAHECTDVLALADAFAEIRREERERCAVLRNALQQIRDYEDSRDPDVNSIYSLFVADGALTAASTPEKGATDV